MRYCIKEHRQRLGLTQDQLKDMLGISKSHVSEMETGKKNPSSPMLQKLADVFGVRPQDLIEATTEDAIRDKLKATADLLPLEDVPLAQRLLEGVLSKADDQ